MATKNKRRDDVWTNSENFNESYIMLCATSDFSMIVVVNKIYSIFVLINFYGTHKQGRGEENPGPGVIPRGPPI